MSVIPREKDLTLIDYISKKIEKIIDNLLEPFWSPFEEWLRRLSSLKRVTVLVIILITFLLVFFYKESLPFLVDNVVRFYRVVTSKNTEIPINASLISKLRETAKRLSGSIQPSINNPPYVNSAWTLAQLIAAGNGLAKIDRDTMRTYLRSISKKSCNCWQEIANESYPPLIPASGWTVFALAEIGIPATDAEIRFFLDQQHEDGWWSLFPVSEESRYASTYGTAWSLLALHNQQSKNLISSSLSTEVTNAISKGSAWLMMHQGSSRWKDYPLLAKGRISESISGLVLHVLHVTSPNSVVQIENAWLDKIPSTVPSAGDSEQNFYWFKTKDDGFQNDKFVQIKLPWLLIATIDAYATGDIFQRVKALAWIEKMLDQESVINAEKKEDNWWRAELLLSIQYALKRSARGNEELLQPKE